MRRVTALLLLLVATVNASAAGNRLSVLTTEEERDDYKIILQRVFHRVYEDDVVLSAILAIGTGAEELATGVRTTPRGLEAFSVFLSASVWSTEYDRFMAGATETCFDAATNKEKPCPPQNRQGLPQSYHGIKTVIKARPLSRDLALRIKGVWQSKVGEALRAPALTDDERGFFGGLALYYAIRSNKSKWATVIGRSFGEETDADRMKDLAVALQGYAVRAVSEKDLQEALRSVEPQRPNPAMQRTATQRSTYACPICSPPFACEADLTGLAVADLVSR